MRTSLADSAGKRAALFSEASAWRSIGAGWKQLSGNFREAGYSVEWYDFAAAEDLDWSPNFHPDGLEICLNLTGYGEVRGTRRVLELGPVMGGYYLQSGSGLRASRRAGQRHQFATVEFSRSFLQKHIGSVEEGKQWLEVLFEAKPGGGAVVSEPRRLTSEQQQVLGALRQAPVGAAAQPLWYQAKALEIAATFLFQPAGEEEFFCQRVKRLNGERVARVRAALKENLAEPPTLGELGRRVGCSPFHLSRIFTQETGKTITGCLRELRLERAADLLRSGQCNVTEAALEVGYNSLSHFTLAFRETFGCCPGLYPLGKGPRAQSR